MRNICFCLFKVRTSQNLLYWLSQVLCGRSEILLRFSFSNAWNAVCDFSFRLSSFLTFFTVSQSGFSLPASASLLCWLCLLVFPPFPPFPRFLPFHLLHPCSLLLFFVSLLRWSRSRVKRVACFMNLLLYYVLDNLNLCSASAFVWSLYSYLFPVDFQLRPPLCARLDPFPPR